ncbi:predicted protein [Nematostella vectensis]|uniref:SOSS complex subunit C homolog n=1 Tax=Nematostella vectensis TaxID=45351 RepID=SOSSC_NEMVE|nr:RecName: Full=SOSS complex subunit C homolog [Nematostella vectensis]EDO45349.1 predicted protein [Nematostella vectensis]|eukprot:XP_001637412.1 predicted protein [Nematostella vectensis]
MAFQQHGNQEVRNRKILQGLEEKKRQMMNQQQGGGAGPLPGPSHVARPPTDAGNTSASRIHEPIVRYPNQTHQLAISQRQALEHAHSVSPGFYITQDSMYGNLILPVIPRVESE